MNTWDDPTERPREERPDGGSDGSDGSGGSTGRRTGWHPVNVGHLVMGVAFAGLVAVWALVTSDTVDLADHGWLMGLPWLAAGAVGLLATVLRGPRAHWTHDWRHDHCQDHWHDDHWRHGNQGSGSMHGWH